MKQRLLLRVSSCALLIRQPLQHPIRMRSRKIQQYSSIYLKMSTVDPNDQDSTLPIDTTAATDNDGRGDDAISLDYTPGRNGKVQKLLSLMASPLTDETGSAHSVVAGLATIALAGTCVGLAAPVNEMLTPSYQKISASLGYIYFMAWSVSFYPQVISNLKRKSTVGLSPDFVVLNVIGFACYTAYNAAFYWSPFIQELYKERYGSAAAITVQSNDVAFAIHALVFSMITLAQILYYNKTANGNTPGVAVAVIGDTTADSSTTRLSKPVMFVILGIIILCIGYPLLVVLGTDSSIDNHANWLDFLYLLSYIKIFISLIKYIPQVLLNFRRKSTMGWSIWNILLDLTGGALSDLQLVLDCADLNDFSGITHNKAKLALGSLSIVFDFVFLFQHYCLYSGATSVQSTGQNEPLLQFEENDRTTGEGNDEVSSSGPPTTFV